MAAAPLRAIIAGEAVGGVLVGAALLVWTGDVASGLQLPSTPASWAVIRLVAMTLVGFSVLLWSVRLYVSNSREALFALAGIHAAIAFVVLIQQLTIWNTGIGTALALAPLGLSIRYFQYALRLRAAESAVRAVGA